MDKSLERAKQIMADDDAITKRLQELDTRIKKLDAKPTKKKARRQTAGSRFDDGVMGAIDRLRGKPKKRGKPKSSKGK